MVDGTGTVEFVGQVCVWEELVGGVEVDWAVV